jgi:hypothetical protein
LTVARKKGSTSTQSAVSLNFSNQIINIYSRFVFFPDAKTKERRKIKITRAKRVQGFLMLPVTYAGKGNKSKILQQCSTHKGLNEFGNEKQGNKKR